MATRVAGHLRNYVGGTPSGLVTRALIALYLLAWLVQWLAPSSLDYLQMSPQAALQRWEFWRLWTGVYFFDANLAAVGWLCLFLWFFGRELEILIGRMDFLLFYQVAGILASLLWAVSTVAGAGACFGWPSPLTCSGAAGGALLLYALYFPTKVWRVAGVLPAPTWLLVIIYLVGDSAFMPYQPSTVPGPAYIGGFLYALIYRQFDLRLSSLRIGRRGAATSMDWDGAEIRELAPDDAELAEQVDAILEKIRWRGLDSLTAEERRLLDEASRRYRKGGDQA